MKKVLVTGATGFIGNHVINELLAKGCDVIATSRTADRARMMEWYPRVKHVPFDLEQMETERDYAGLFGHPHILIHLAWEGLPRYKETFHFETNLPRHYRFIKTLVEQGVNDITITGTCFEYGLQEGSLSEDMPVNPVSSYAVAKNTLRQFLTELSGTNPFILKWIRLFYMYGKGQNPNSLLSQLQSAIDKGEEVFRMSPGDQLRDYLPVEEVARNIVKVALQKDVTGIINCASGNPISIKDLVLAYLHEQGASIKLDLGYYNYNDIEPRNFWGDITKLKTITENE